MHRTVEPGRPRTRREAPPVVRLPVPPAIAESIRLLRFDWMTRAGLQPVIYLDRRRLD